MKNMMKKLLTGLALLGGEAIIIAAFVLFRGQQTDHILILNIVVTSFIYGLLCFEMLVPWINPSDPAQRTVGSMGVRWFFAGMYILAAAVVMLVGNVAFRWTFSLQLIIHLSLVVLWLFGIMSVQSVNQRIEKVHQVETLNSNGLANMKQAMMNLQDKMSETADLPDYFVQRMRALEEELRFLSPANQDEASALEQDFVRIIDEISYAVSEFAMNEEKIAQLTEKVESIYKKRKIIYSH